MPTGLIDKLGKRQTALCKIRKNYWEFCMLSLEARENAKKKCAVKENQFLNKEGLQSLIDSLEQILKEGVSIFDKKFYPIKWNKNPNEMILWAGVRKETIWCIYFYVKNKYRLNFKYKPDEYGWDDRATPETYGGMTIETTEENIRKYIEDLKEELRRDEEES